MADDKQYLEVGFKFEDEGQITPRIQRTLKQVSSRVKLNLDLGLDSFEMDSLINKLGKVNKQSFTLFDNGTEKTITDVNIGLSQTIKLQEQINKNGDISQKYTVTDNSAQATKSLYNELIKLQETEFKIKTQMLSADGEQLKVLQQQLSLTSTLQNTLGKSINKNGLTDNEFNNRLVKERLNLNNELIKSQAKVSESVNAQIQKTLEEEKATLRLIEVKKKNLGTKIDSLQNKYGSNKDAVAELERLRNAINKVNGSDLKQVRYEFQMLETDIKSATNKAQSQLSNITKTDSKSMMDNLKANVSSLATYALGGSFVYSTINTFRDAINYTVEMNSAMTNLKKVTSETDEVYSKFTNTMHTMSMELGTQSNLMTDAVSNWVKTGQSLENATKLAENTIILKNVGDLKSVDDAMRYLVPSLKAYNMEANNSIQLVDKFNNISNNMATDVNNLGEAMARSASALALSGNSIDQSLALLATAESKTKLGGESVGTALRTISLRLAEFKDSDTGEPLVKLSGDLNKVGIAATDMNGQVRSSFDVLMDLAKIWNTLDKNTQLDLAQGIGGKRQANFVAAIVSDMDALQKAYDLASNSQNSAMNEFAKYQESIQYSIDRLKESVNGFYLSLTDDSSMKSFINLLTGVVEGVTKVIDTIGAFPTVITAATVALGLFNKSFQGMIVNSKIPVLSNMSKTFNSMRTDILSAATAKTVDTVATEVNTVAQQGNTGATVGNTTAKGANTVATGAMTISMGVATIATYALQAALMALGIGLVTGAVAGLISLADKLIVTKDEMAKMNQELLITNDNLSKTTSSAENYYNKLQKLQEELANTTDVARRAELEKEIADTQKQIASILPETTSYINQQGEGMAANNGIIEETIRLKKEEMALNSEAFLKNNKGFTDEIKNIKLRREEYEKMNLANKQGKDTYTKTDLTPENYYQQTGVRTYDIQRGFNSSDLEKANKKVQEDLKNALEIQKEIKRLKDLGSTDNEIKLMYDIDVQALEDFINSVGKVGNESNNAQPSVDALGNEISNLTVSAEEAKDKINELSDAFSKNNSEIKILEGALKEFNELGGLTLETKEKIFNTGNMDMIALLGDPENFANNATNALNAMMASRDKAHNDIINYAMAEGKVHAEVEQNKVNNTVNSSNARANAEANVSNNNGRAYGTDSLNHSNAEVAKSQNVNSSVNARAKTEASMVGANASTYGTDSLNHSNYLNSKLQNTKSYVDQTNDMLNRISEGDLEAEKLWMRKNNKNNNNNGYTPVSYVPTTSSYVPTVSSPSTGSGGGGQSASKTVQEYKPVLDLFYNISNAIDDVNDKLEANRLLQEQATGRDKINLMNEEIKLLQEQARLTQELTRQQEARANQLKQQIASKGGQFDGNGNLTNYNSLLDKTATGAQADALKELEKLIQEYTKLTQDEIGKSKNEWQSLNNEIKKIQQEKANLIADTEKKISDALEKELTDRNNKLKKSLDEKKEILNKQWKEEDYQDNLNSKQGELADIEAEMNRLANDTSREGQLRYKQLLAEYEQKQKEINDFIKESQRENINNRFDEEQNLLDKDLEEQLKPENMNKLISDLLGQGFTSINGEIIKLDDLMSSYLSDSTIGTTNLAIAQKELNDQLAQTKASLGDISAIYSSLGLGGNITYPTINLPNQGRNIQPVSNNQSISIAMPITIEGNVTEDVLPKIEKIFDKKIKTATDRIAKELTNH